MPRDDALGVTSFYVFSPQADVHAPVAVRDGLELVAGW